MIYAMSDLHGHADKFREMLDKINFSQNDILYVIGDAIDRGPDSLGCLQIIMESPNIIMLLGNHEKLMLDTVAAETDFLDPDSYSDDKRRWFRNGGEFTLNELRQIDKKRLDNILDYLRALPLHKLLEVGGRRFLLTHAGLNLSCEERPDGACDKSVEEFIQQTQTVRDLVWPRAECYENKGIEGLTMVFGHTATYRLNPDQSPGLWQSDGKICIDGGCYQGRGLLCLCLDTMEVYAVKSDVVYQRPQSDSAPVPPPTSAPQ